MTSVKITFFDWERKRMVNKPCIRVTLETYKDLRDNIQMKCSSLDTFDIEYEDEAGDTCIMESNDAFQDACECLEDPPLQLSVIMHKHKVLSNQEEIKIIPTPVNELKNQVELKVSQTPVRDVDFDSKDKKSNLISDEMMIYSDLSSFDKKKSNLLLKSETLQKIIEGLQIEQKKIQNEISSVEQEKRAQIIKYMNVALDSCSNGQWVWIHPSSANGELITSKWVLTQIESFKKKEGFFYVTFKNKQIVHDLENYSEYVDPKNTAQQIYWVPSICSLSLSQVLISTLNEKGNKVEFDPS